MHRRNFKSGRNGDFARKLGEVLAPTGLSIVFGSSLEAWEDILSTREQSVQKDKADVVDSDACADDLSYFSEETQFKKRVKKLGFFQFFDLPLIISFFFGYDGVCFLLHSGS